MKKNLLFLSSALVLAACGTTSGGEVWKKKPHQLQRPFQQQFQIQLRQPARKQ